MLWSWGIALASGQVRQVGAGLAFDEVAAAVAAASDGDTIEIHAGVYAEQVAVFDLDLAFVGIGDPVLAPPAGAPGFFTLGGDSVVDIDGVVFDGGGEASAMRLQDAARVTLRGSTVRDTRSPGGGGAAYVRDQAMLTVEDSAFVAGTAATVGGFLQLDDSAHLQVTDSSFTDGSSDGDGGAIYCGTLGGCSLHGAVFVGNQAGGRGGAVLATDTSPFEASASWFCDNVSGAHGGAVHLYYRAEIDTSVFVGNIAGGDGGAVYLNGLTPSDPLSLSHVDLLGNASSGQGAAVFVLEGVLELDHAIVAGHSGPADAVALGGLGSHAADYNLYWDNASDGVPALGGAHDVRGMDPLLASVHGCLDSDLSLLPGSPAIDAGDPARPDPDGSPADIGAFGPALVEEDPPSDTATTTTTTTTPTPDTPPAPDTTVRDRGSSPGVVRAAGCACRTGAAPAAGWWGLLALGWLGLRTRTPWARRPPRRTPRPGSTTGHRSRTRTARPR